MVVSPSTESTHSAIIWDLKDYLSGHALARTMRAFEDVLGPFVKDKVRKHFAEDPNCEPPHIAEYRKELTDGIHARTSTRTNLCEKRMELEKQLPDSLDRETDRDYQNKVKKNKEWKANDKDLKKVLQNIKVLDNEDEAANTLLRSLDEMKHRKEKWLLLEVEKEGIEKDLEAGDKVRLLSVLQELGELEKLDADASENGLPPPLWIYKCR